MRRAQIVRGVRRLRGEPQQEPVARHRPPAGRRDATGDSTLPTVRHSYRAPQLVPDHRGIPASTGNPPPRLLAPQVRKLAGQPADLATMTLRHRWFTIKSVVDLHRQSNHVDSAAVNRTIRNWPDHQNSQHERAFKRASRDAIRAHPGVDAEVCFDPMPWERRTWHTSRASRSPRQNHRVAQRTYWIPWLLRDGSA